MLAPRPTVESSLRSAENRQETTLVSLVAAKAGREVIWVLIASVFFVVEAAVFLTELPATKLFPRRDATKLAGHGRR